MDQMAAGQAVRGGEIWGGMCVVCVCVCGAEGEPRACA
jgi:hypothetical protein